MKKIETVVSKIISVALVICFSCTITDVGLYAAELASDAQQKTISVGAASSAPADSVLYQQEADSYQQNLVAGATGSEPDPVATTTIIKDTARDLYKVYGYNATQQLVAYAEYRLLNDTDQGTILNNDIRTYYSNGNIKSKYATTYTESTGKVSTIIDYRYLEDNAGKYAYSNQYRVNSDGSQGTLSKTTEYIYLGTTAKASLVLTYHTDGTTVTQREENFEYYTNKNIKAKHVTTYSATTGAATAIYDYLYAEANSGYYQATYQYYVTADGLQGNLYKASIDYVYNDPAGALAGTVQSKKTIVYEADGVTINKNEYYTYTYHSNKKMATQSIVTKNATNTLTLQTDDYTYNTSASAIGRKLVTYRATDGTKSKETNYIYLGTTAKTSLVLTYHTDGTTLTQRDEYTYDTTTKAATWKKTTTYRSADGTKSKETEYIYLGTTAKASLVLTYHTDGTTVTQREENFEYYTNKNIKAKHVTTYSATTGAATAIYDYLYAEADANHYTAIYRYRVKSDGTRGTLYTWTGNYVYGAGDFKDLVIAKKVITYSSNGTTVTQNQYYAYTYHSNKKMATQNIITKNAADTATTQTDDYTYYMANGYAASKHTIKYNASTGAMTTNEKYEYSPSTSSRKIAYSTYKLDTSNTVLTQTTYADTAANKRTSLTEFVYDATGAFTGKNEYTCYASGNLYTGKEYNAAGTLMVDKTYYDSTSAVVQTKIAYTYYTGYLFKEVTDYYPTAVLKKEAVYYEIPGVATLVLKEIFHSETAYITKRVDYNYHASGGLQSVMTSDYGAALKTYVAYADAGFNVLGAVAANYSWRLWKGIDMQVKTLGYDLSVKPEGAGDDWQPCDGWYMDIHGYIMEYVNVGAAGTYQLTFMASGTKVNGEWPNLQISVDGLYREVVAINNEANATLIYTINLDLTAGIHSISLDFVNDTINDLATGEYRSITLGDIQLAAAAYDKPLPTICTATEWQTYKAAQEAQVLAQAQADIEENRKGDASVTVVNGGTAVANAAVTIEEVEHDFRFGGNYCFTDRFFNEENGLQKMVQYNLALLNKFDTLADQATVGFFWKDINVQAVRNTDGTIDVLFDTAGVDITLGMLAQKGITDIVGAALIWGNTDAMPTAWLEKEGLNLTAAEKELALKMYVQKVIKYYSDPALTVTSVDINQPFDPVTGEVRWVEVGISIKTWEVLNEPYYVGTFDFLGTKAEAIKKIFDWADEARTEVYKKYAAGQPTNDIKLMLNDYVFLVNGNKLVYEDLQQLVSEVKFDILGIQAHHFVDNVYVNETCLGGFDVPFQLDDLKRTLDLFASLGKEIYISEFEMPSNDHPIVGSPWRGAVWDEAAQAQYIVDFYTLIFSHPAITGITYWDMFDHATDADGQWCPDAGVLTEEVITDPVTGEIVDIGTKQAYADLYNLINNEWMTKLASGTTNASGCANLGSVFYGKYKVSVTINGETRIGYYDIANGADDLVIDFSTMTLAG